MSLIKVLYLFSGGTIFIFHNFISFFRVIDHHHREHHILQHWQIFQCESCDYYSEKVSETQKHVKTEHGITDYQPYKCNQCDYTSGDFQCFSRHVLRHFAEYNIVCTECGSTHRQELLY